MKSCADWGNGQGNSARCFLYFPNEINSLGRHFGSHQPPHPSVPLGPMPGRTSRNINDFSGRLSREVSGRLTEAQRKQGNM
jgi:hypothetical protein